MTTIFSLPVELLREIADNLVLGSLAALSSLIRTCRYFLTTLSEKFHTHGLLTAHLNTNSTIYHWRLKLHIRKGAKVNTYRTYQISADGRDRRFVKKTALHDAVRLRNIPAVKILLEGGVNVNAISSTIRRHRHMGREPNEEELYWESALFRAIDSPVKTGNEELVRVLLEHGANVECGSSLGGPLHAAVLRRRNGKQIAQILIDYSADVNTLHRSDGISAIGGRPIHAASTHITTQFLLDNKADMNAEDAQGRTALFTTLRRMEKVPKAEEYLRDKALLLQRVGASCRDREFRYQYDWNTRSFRLLHGHVAD